MEKANRITSFALALLVAGGINISSLSVQASEIKLPTKIIAFSSEEDNLTGANIVAYAKEFIGTPYRSGGTTTAGFDCSGFTKYVFSHFNVELPRIAKDQTSEGTVVRKSDLQAGDLIFFGSSIYHVGIYIGDGKFIHSPKPGSSVRIEKLKYMPGYNTARRIAAE